MSHLLDPKILLSIKNLQLAAKATVDSFMMGINKSNHKGQGIEFSQYRVYEPGDDLRSLDWKMYARSDRYYIRESEVETSITVRFIIDASNSMNHTSQGISKCNYAQYVAASLGYLASKQGDAIGLYVCKENTFEVLPAKKDAQHAQRFYYHLAQITPSGKFIKETLYRPILRGSKTKELLVVITDFYQQQQEIMDLINDLTAAKNEVLVLHVMADNEINFTYEDYTSLEDLETGTQVNINDSNIKTQYQQRLQAYLFQIKKQLLDKGVAYALMMTNEPLEQVLKDFLKQRNKTNR